MKKPFLILSILLLMSFINPVRSYQHDDDIKTGWKAGVASIIITPEESMWMAGYSARKEGAKGKLHEIMAKALVLEDSKGEQVVLLTTDLLGMPKAMSDLIRDQLEAKFDFSRAEIILNSSHTHSGPVLENALVDIYPLNAEEQEKVERYSKKLSGRIVSLVGQALKDLQPVSLFAENGVTRFQVNRRNNRAATLHKQSDLKGPNDYAVPVIKVVDASGNMMAVTFGYACHPTVLDGLQWSGDYAGFAQLELEKAYPGVTALFFQGAGADQNPLPRKTVPLAEQYGQSLAAAVQRVLNEPMRKLPATVSTAYTEIDLPLAEPPTLKELEEMSNTYKGYQKRWAQRLYEEVASGKKLRTSYPYPLQVWQLGDQIIMSLGGELVVEYSIGLKKAYGHDIFVMGYSNDVMGYIPSDIILEEGGYEGESSQMVYGLPNKWAKNIEEVIYTGMAQLAKEIGISKVSSKAAHKD